MLLKLAPHFSFSHCVNEISGYLYLLLLKIKVSAYINMVGSRQKSTPFRELPVINTR